MSKENQKLLPKWILFVSGFFALMEITVGISLLVSPQSVIESIDFKAIGVDYLIYMWATRQIALGVIFGFSTLKRSRAMLTITYIFLLVMFIGDLCIGVLKNENGLLIGAIVMCVVSSLLLFKLNRLKE